ncbi:MAG: AAA domain-containing protein [Bacillota bacterium]
MNPIYRKYKERFIQISGRNRSLYLKNIVKKYSYDVGSIMENRADTDDFTDFLWHKRNSFTLVDNKVVAKIVTRAQKLEAQETEAAFAPFDALAAADDAVDLQFDEIAAPIKSAPIKPDKEKVSARLEREIASLRYLKREVEELEKETGRYELFLGYPFVVGDLTSDIPLKAPLMLFPVTLTIEKEEAILRAVPNQPIMYNKAFLLAYTKERNIKDIMVQEFDPINDNFAENIQAAIDYLIKNNIKLKPARRKSLVPFDASQDTRIDGLEIRNMAVLGRFPLANSIYNDYLVLEKDNLTTSSIDALLSTANSSKNEGKIIIPKRKFFQKTVTQTPSNEPLFYEINDLDYTQEYALSEIADKDNIVIYGPPGTGKSQTIVNIISDALCKKKKVLVVSQKRAALDVVFSRLGKLNNKAMLIPDPEKDKITFFERLRDMHAITSMRDYDVDIHEHRNVELNIRNELATLEGISATLFTKTAFGLTLQQMYAASYNIGKNTTDYDFYNELQKTGIIKRNYPELSKDIKLIKDKSLAKLFVTMHDLLANNEMIMHVLPNLEMHALKEAQSFITKLLNKKLVPFDNSKYPYSRYLTTFYLEKDVADRKSIAQVADIITSVKHPSLSKVVTACHFPLLWPVYPIVKTKYNGYREDIKIDLNIACRALEDHEKEYRVIANVLDTEGYAMAIGSLINGNVDFIRKLQRTLENYVKYRDMTQALQALSVNVREILEFAYKNSDMTVKGLNATIDKIVPIRIYHEIVQNDSYIEEFLCKTVTFGELRQRIISLKEEQRVISLALANDSFGKSYADYFNKHNNKDFLYEIQKQRGLKPIRRMFEYFEQYLLRLFPCWLLSPDVVSTILPLKSDLFDLIVFDEASQVFIESAIPAIYRGTKVVVAGDNKQLRPTAGFVKRYFGDTAYMDPNMDLSTQAALEVESLLDLATARYTPVYLSYHYRSNHAELIDFSNAAFYDNKLQIAPNIARNDSDVPISRIKVKGTWQNRHNHEEAVAVVKLVRSIMREREFNESIGIVTFNTEQKEYIEDLLDAEGEKVKIFAKQLDNERKRIVDGENASLFVKNLENVQGDERDIIIFSIGYARNDCDKVVTQFGSLSMEGGENRLNVAITRAKKKIYVVTSIEPEELDRVETNKNMGPKLLKRYLQYVRAVSERDVPEVKRILDSLHTTNKPTEIVGAYESQIKTALEKLGYDVDINLGNTKYKLSLGVYDKALNQYVLGIECDYQAFNSTESVLERDVFRIKFLESRGWKIMRVWSRDWWLSPSKVLDDIVSAIESEKRQLTAKKLQEET